MALPCFYLKFLSVLIWPEAVLFYLFADGLLQVYAPGPAVIKNPDTAVSQLFGDIFLGAMVTHRLQGLGKLGMHKSNQFPVVSNILPPALFPGDLMGFIYKFAYGRHMSAKPRVMRCSASCSA